MESIYTVFTVAINKVERAGVVSYTSQILSWIKVLFGGRFLFHTLFNEAMCLKDM